MQLNSPCPQVFGEKGEYFELSKGCYDFADHSAVYKVCPWDKVEQRQKGHTFRVGRKGHWETRHKNKQILVMDEGERRGCPAAPRRAEVFLTALLYICTFSTMLHGYERM